MSNNLFAKQNNIQRPISKGRPKLLELTNTNDFNNKVDSNQLKGFLSNKGNEKLEIENFN